MVELPTFCWLLNSQKSDHVGLFHSSIKKFPAFDNMKVMNSTKFTLYIHILTILEQYLTMFGLLAMMSEVNKSLLSYLFTSVKMVPPPF